MQSFLSNRSSTAATQGGVPPPAGTATFQRLFDETAQSEARGARDVPRLDVPQVDVVEENGRVSRIVVTCKCCERIELACQY